MALSDSKILFWNGKNPLKAVHFDVVDDDKDRVEQPSPSPVAAPSLCGLPLKYSSYVFPIRRRHPHISYGSRPFLVPSSIVRSVYSRVLILFFSVLLH